MITLKIFTELNEQEITLVWQWRNDEKVNQFMHTKNFDIKKHKNFIQSLKQDKTKKYFLVFDKNESIGVIDFININQQSCYFGLYAKPDLKGVGQTLMDEVKKYAFEILKVKELKACVLKQNAKALKLYFRNNFTITKEDENFFYIALVNSIK
ncbi:UDP-4-amino-4,6-dideoxy-N-acetyl-beta-L-altrosamine N-acetyltransferase [Campylobacter estrildidarum]|uniref:UDP-4-amino-4, 6-dideoxy-N-acetyl-beta-L-altrosamine N-acetyltransferase n=1 Tax=Campylobacter estrildidarum TaxID=2510189 RepID=A0A4U7BD79_9BACT|nr:UDP-4-amino-4,6-dideoxy-N-acetyl-beta-L-altrosamine N-acetyltransferase [Campylobacter estrildidarum]TKX29478.1 UDP-4-amino-4,6-dideoxy-N-acetyl-beta-L-altrosamine N-acetyltransferase [Campylobacter estrildidarum]